MAWICLDLDDTLVQKEPTSGEELPVTGAPESVQTLAQEGHRLTVWTSRFAPMPESRKQQEKEALEAKLLQMGFPELEVWTGSVKPAADLFLGSSMVTFDNDWGLALAQMQMMMEERGLVPPPTGADPEEEASAPVEG